MIHFSPLQLKGHFFSAVSIRANPDGKQEGPVLFDQHVVHLRVKDKPNHWHLEIFLNHRSEDSKRPFVYEIYIHVVGVVEVSEEVAEEKREIIAGVNGLGLLYGAAREMVLNITARGPHGAYCLPSLNFAEVLKHAKQAPIPSHPPEHAPLQAAGSAV